MAVYSGQGQQPVFLGSLLSALDASGDLPPAFDDLRERFDRVMSYYDAGELSPERLAGQLSSLRCFDDAGSAWTIGASSGLWYRMTDDGWLQAPPPYRSAPARAVSGLYGNVVDDEVPAEGSGGAHSDIRPSALPADGPSGPVFPSDEVSSDDGLLFGLPEQLLPGDVALPGPVPSDGLPSADYAHEDRIPPAPRADGPSGLL